MTLPAAAAAAAAAGKRRRASKQQQQQQQPHHGSGAGPSASSSPPSSSSSSGFLSLRTPLLVAAVAAVVGIALAVVPWSSIPSSPSSNHHKPAPHQHQHNHHHQHHHHHHTSAAQAPDDSAASLSTASTAATATTTTSAETVPSSSEPGEAGEQPAAAEHDMTRPRLSPRAIIDESKYTYDALVQFASSDKWAFAHTVPMVYTWANGSDPARIELKSQYRPPVSVDDDDDDDGEEPAEGDEAAQAAAEARRKMKYDGVQRDRDNGELRWSVRSLERFLPWWKGELVLVAPRGQVPDWLDETNDRVRIVAQEDIVPEEANPTFNTNAIEQFLYKIPNLPSTFVHLNDDFFFASPIWPWELFTEHGHPLVHYEATKLHGGTEIYEKLLIEHPEYAWFASVFRTNGAIYEKFHVWQNYIRHAPMVYYRDVFPIFHDLFGDLLRNTSTSRFRSPHDMVTPYLHHGITLSHEYSSEYPVGALPVHEAIDEVYVMIRVTDDMQLTVDEVVKYLFDGSKDQRDDEDNDKEDGGEVRLPPRPKVKMFVLNDDYGKDVGQSAFIQKVLETYYGDLRSSFEK